MSDIKQKYFIPPQCIARHRHRGRCRWHPVSQSGTGAFLYRTGSGNGFFVHSGTGLTGCRTVRHLKNTLLCEKEYIQPARDGLGYTRHVHIAGGGKGYTTNYLNILYRELQRMGCTHTRLRAGGWGCPNSDDWSKGLALCLHCGIHPARPYCSARNYRPCFRENQPKRLFSIKWKRAFWACVCENWVYKFGHRCWKGIQHTTCTHLLQEVERDTPCNSTLLAVERHTPCTSILLVLERDTPCTSILLVEDRDRPCTFVLLAVERDRPCTYVLLAVERDRPCTYVLLAVERDRPCTLGYSDFHNLMGFTSKKMPNNIL
jgi:hypothetical protein